MSSSTEDKLGFMEADYIIIGMCSRSSMHFWL